MRLMCHTSEEGKLPLDAGTWFIRIPYSERFVRKGILLVWAKLCFWHQVRMVQYVPHVLVFECSMPKK